MPETFQEMVTRVLRAGPDAVLIDTRGTVVRPSDANTRDGVVTTIIFLRRDGTSVGTSKYYERVAFQSEQWVGYVRTNETEGELIAGFVTVTRGGNR